MKKLILVLSLMLLISPGIWANCNDTVDDDGDGFTDYNVNGEGDIGCSSAGDATEGDMDGTTWLIPCTDDAVFQALNDMCPTGGITINFNCSNTTIVFDWDSAFVTSVGSNNISPPDRYDIAPNCHGNIIDGQTNNIVWEPDSDDQWRNRSVCGVVDNNPANLPCNGGTDQIPTGCPSSEETTPRLMVIRSDNNIIRNFTIRNWMDGFRFNGDSNSANTGDTNTITNMTCEYPGDTCFSGDPGTFTGTGNIIQNSTIRYTCDKAVQLYGRDSGWGSAADFDIKIDNVDCIDSNGCIRDDLGNGYFIVNDLFVDEVSPPNSQFNCDYALYSSGASGGGTFRVTNSEVRDCNEGFNFTDDSEGQVSYTVFNNIAAEAIRSWASALVSVDNCSFTNTTATALDVETNAWLDAGSTDTSTAGLTLRAIGNVVSPGRNSFSGATTGVNETTSTTVYAENNCWDDADPSNEVVGTVDALPVATGACPTPLSTPSSVRNSLIRNGKIGR